jgi:hypothetical protein
MFDFGMSASEIEQEAGRANWLSRFRPKEIRDLLLRMVTENRTWGAAPPRMTN